MSTTTNNDLQALVDDLRTMIRSDQTADPAARAMAVIVLELAAATIFNLQRIADAIEKLSAPPPAIERDGSITGKGYIVEKPNT